MSEPFRLHAPIIASDVAEADAARDRASRRLRRFTLRAGPRYEAALEEYRKAHSTWAYLREAWEQPRTVTTDSAWEGGNDE